MEVLSNNTLEPLGPNELLSISGGVADLHPRYMLNWAHAVLDFTSGFYTFFHF